MAQTSDPHEVVESALAFALESLGRASAAHLGRPEVQALLLARVRHGAEVPDAALGVVHGAAKQDPALAGEFVGYFLERLMGIARPSISPQLRQLLDTQDLVQSVITDLWPELDSVEFTSRAAFVSLLAQRVRWKTVDRARRGQRARRREDLRVAVDPAELEIPQGGPTPHGELEEKEAGEAFEAILGKLSDRDGAMLRMHAKGAKVDELMAHFGLEREAARKALQRAVRRAQKLGEGFGREPSNGDAE